jgi:hypothetical protein
VSGPKQRSSVFEMLGHAVRMDCRDGSVHELLTANFGAMPGGSHARCPAVHYTVSQVHRGGALSLERQGGSTIQVDNLYDLLFHLEKDLTIWLQQRRPDLFFVHAAAVELGGKAFILAAASGSGKSTTTWGLLHAGFRYLSDELSPIHLPSMQVQPYPHALCLKRRPPHYPLPEGTVNLGRTLHVPVARMPADAVAAPLPLAGIFVIQYSPDRLAPEVRAISRSEAAALLYTNALNALAHGNYGLDAVAQIAEALPCYKVEAADLRLTCAALRAKAEEAIAGSH